MKIRKLIAVGTCGLVMGGVMSVFTTAPATARIYRTCDSKVATMERQAAKDYQKGVLSEEDYLKVQSEIDYHKNLWGC